MTENKPLLAEAIKSAERAISLLKTCEVTKKGAAVSKVKARYVFEAAHDELTDAISNVADLLRDLRKTQPG